MDQSDGPKQLSHRIHVHDWGKAIVNNCGNSVLGHDDHHEYSQTDIVNINIVPIIHLDRKEIIRNVLLLL